MFKKILVPVDLAHADKLEKALGVAGRLASTMGAKTVYAGVTTSAPSSVAHNPEEFHARIDEFAAAHANEHGVEVEGLALVSHDPARDLADTLVKAAEDNGCDAIVMASHVPGLADHVFASNASQVAREAPMSVFVVR